MKKDCPYCEGKNGETFLVAGTNIRLKCEYCVKGHIPTPGEDRAGLLARVIGFFRADDATP